MISMALISIVLSAVIMTVFGNQNFLAGEQANSEAMNIGQENLELEQVMARKDFQMVNPTSTTSDDIYKEWISVGPSSNPMDYFSKQVTSYVSWTDDSKVTRILKLSTIVTDFTNAIGGNTCNSFLTGNWANSQINNSNTSFASLVRDVTGVYTITDLDAYQGKLYLTANATAIATSPTNPTVGSDDTTDGGSLSWTSTENITAQNNSTAKVTLSATTLTHYIKATGFNFNIPAGATILGITVKIERFTNGGTKGNGADSHVKIIKGGSMTDSTDEPVVGNWPSSKGTFQSYGGTSDLWGQTWEPSDINSGSFGVAFAGAGTTSSTNRIANIDNIQITITYTKEFYVFDITDPSNPFFISGLGSNPIAGGLNAVATNGSYAYVATGSATGQLEIINLGIKLPGVLSTLKIGTAGNSVGSSIFYRNGYVYLGLTNTSGGPPEFNIIDVHNPFIPTLSGTYKVGYTVNSIIVRNNYAYIAHPTDSSATNQEQVTVLNIGNPAGPQRISGFHAPDNQGNGKSIYSVDDHLYLGRTVNTTGSNRDFYILNNIIPSSLSDNNRASPQPAGVKINTSINGLIIRDYLAFLLTGTASASGQLQVLNIASTTNIVVSSIMTLPNASGGVSNEAIDCEGNYMYVSSVPSTGTNTGKGNLFVISP